jgi:hypothetical protein
MARSVGNKVLLLSQFSPALSLPKLPIVATNRRVVEDLTREGISYSSHDALLDSWPSLHQRLQSAWEPLERDALGDWSHLLLDEAAPHYFWATQIESLQTRGVDFAFVQAANNPEIPIIRAACNFLLLPWCHWGGEV